MLCMYRWFSTIIHSVLQCCCKTECLKSSELYFESSKCQKGQSQWLHGVMCGSVAARLLRLRVGCPPLVNAVYCQVEVSATGRSLDQRSPAECGVSVAGIICSHLHTICQWVQAPASEQAESKLAMLITHRNEKAWQFACRSSIHHSTSQRWTKVF